MQTFWCNVFNFSQAYFTRKQSCLTLYFVHVMIFRLGSVLERCRIVPESRNCNQGSVTPRAGQTDHAGSRKHGSRKITRQFHLFNERLPTSLIWVFRTKIQPVFILSSNVPCFEWSVNRIRPSCLWNECVLV